MAVEVSSCGMLLQVLCSKGTSAPAVCGAPALSRTHAVAETDLTKLQAQSQRDELLI